MQAARNWRQDTRVASAFYGTQLRRGQICAVLLEKLYLQLLPLSTLQTAVLFMQSCSSTMFSARDPRTAKVWTGRLRRADCSRPSKYPLARVSRAFRRSLRMQWFSRACWPASEVGRSEATDWKYCRQRNQTSANGKPLHRSQHSFRAVLHLAVRDA